MKKSVAVRMKIEAGSVATYHSTQNGIKHQTVGSASVRAAVSERGYQPKKMCRSI